MSVFQKVRGWIGLLFSVGIDGPQLAWDEAADGSADRLKVLRGDQTAETSVVYSKVAGADPTAAQDFLTMAYGDVTYAPISAASPSSVRTIEIPLVNTDVGSTVSSSAPNSIPAGAKVTSVKIRVDIAFSNADNEVTVGNTAEGASAFAGVDDSKLNKVGTYDLPQYTDNTALDVVDAVVSGTAAAAGTAFILISYSTPDA